MIATISTDYYGKIKIGTNELDKRFGAGIVVIKMSDTKNRSVTIGLTEAEALKATAAIIETMSALRPAMK